MTLFTIKKLTGYCISPGCETLHFLYTLQLFNETGAVQAGTVFLVSLQPLIAGKEQQREVLGESGKSAITKLLEESRESGLAREKEKEKGLLWRASFHL